MKSFLLVLFLFMIKLGIAQQNWQGFGPYLFAYDIRSIFVDNQLGEMYVGGAITGGSGSSNYLFKWDGAEWISLGKFSGPINTIVKYNDTLFVGGHMIHYNDSLYTGPLAKQVGDSFVGMGANSLVGNLKVLNGKLIVMGAFTEIGNDEIWSLAEYESGQWNDVNSFNPGFNGGFVNDVIYYQDELYVGGNFRTDNDIGDLAVYKNNTWQPVGTGIKGANSTVNKMIIYQNELYVGGAIFKEEGNVGNMIQKWDGINWSEVGGGMRDSQNGLSGFSQVLDMFIFNNELWVAGQFSYAGSIPAMFLAKWNGTEWCSFGTFFENGVLCINEYNGELFIGGAFEEIDGDSVNCLAKWIGGNYVDTCGSLTSINENEFIENNLEIYPNPTNGSFSVNFNMDIPGDVTINMFNTLGQQVYSKFVQNVAGQASVELSPGKHLNSGTYYIQVVSDNFVISKPLVLYNRI